MKIEWNKVTWYSKLAAVIVFVGAFVLAFWLGGVYRNQYQLEKYQQLQEMQRQTEEITEQVFSPDSKYTDETRDLVQDIERFLRKDGASDAFVDSFRVYKLDKNLESEEVLVSYGVLIDMAGHGTLVDYYRR